MERGYLEQTRIQDEIDMNNVNRQSPGWRVTLPNPGAVARALRERRKSRALEKARNSQTGLYTLTMLAGWAIRLAARAEPDRKVRSARRNLLLDTWNRFSGNLGRQTRL
jgi:hypothetical protein